MIVPFFPLLVYACFAGFPTAKCWDRAFGDSQPLWSVGATEEGPGKNLPFSVANKRWLLAMMTLYFGSGFAAPFFKIPTA